eukprot:TRINITY_DN89957_c0_g1_i1.p1 TRINITY_DN89957_c0_g1~~TRINITY_DN89957_c0_g1_i1.p1  ORF type:complete len:156 (+),score=49.16 TRINITY_DN89957_c0_g1_i1:3-470(+)
MASAFEESSEADSPKDKEQEAALERKQEEESEADAKEESADMLAYSAREHAIHEAWKHSERANELAKEAAETSLESAHEAMQARRILDQHDVIAIENQTQVDLRKAEVVRGLEVPWPLALLPPPPPPVVSCRGSLLDGPAASSRLRRFDELIAFI